MQCSILVLPYQSSCEAYKFTTDEYGIFNVHTNLGACHTHEGGSGTNKSAQEFWLISDLFCSNLYKNMATPHGIFYYDLKLNKDL